MSGNLLVSFTANQIRLVRDMFALAFVAGVDEEVLKDLYDELYAVAQGDRKIIFTILKTGNAFKDAFVSRDIDDMESRALEGCHVEDLSDDKAMCDPKYRAYLDCSS